MGCQDLGDVLLCGEVLGPPPETVECVNEYPGYFTMLEASSSCNKVRLDVSQCSDWISCISAAFSAVKVGSRVNICSGRMHFACHYLAQLLVPDGERCL